MTFSGYVRSALIARLATNMLLLAVVLTGCKTNPALMYRTGYDKMLTQQSWTARKPDEGVVLIGGYPSVWQKADEPGYAFETRQRFRIDWTHGYDAAIVKAGRYQLQTIVLGSGNWASFGGFKGLGVSSSPVIATFEVGAGELVYVGDLEADVLTEGYANCAATLSVKDSEKLVVHSLPKQIPYLQREPKVIPMNIEQNLVRFPCGEAY
jgi:hypothetical protein